MSDAPSINPGSMTRHQALVVCATALATIVLCGALCAAAILVPAPAGVVPVVALCCVGMPIFATWELPSAIAVVRTRHRAAMSELQRALAQLPEVDHPLGL